MPVALTFILILGIGISQWRELRREIPAILGYPVLKDTIAWQTNLSVAQSLSRKLHKPMVVEFGAPWCYWCNVMKAHVWPDLQVHNLVEASFIPVSIDVDSPAGTRLAQQYAVRGIPAIFIMDSQGNVLDASNTMTTAQTIEFLKTSLTALAQHSVSR